MLRKATQQLTDLGAGLADANHNLHNFISSVVSLFNHAADDDAPKINKSAKLRDCASNPTYEFDPPKPLKRCALRKDSLFLEIDLADYRRCYLPGGSFFFTVVTERRAGILANDRARDCLRQAIRDCRDQWHFHVDALVILPDHIHAIWTMPQDDGDYSKRWGMIKKRFTQNWLASGGAEQSVSASRLRYRRRGIWQRRFWEHALRDERDYQNHFDYLDFNPIKHGLVNNASDWPYFSFHHWVKQGVYPPNWGSIIEDRIHLDNVRDAGE